MQVGMGCEVLAVTVVLVPMRAASAKEWWLLLPVSLQNVQHMFCESHSPPPQHWTHIKAGTLWTSLRAHSSSQRPVSLTSPREAPHQF